MAIRSIALLCATSLFIVVGCNHESDQPAVTLKVTDCAVANIAMTPNARVTGSTNRWTVHLSVTVTCNGAPVNNAEIKVKYPWIPAFKIETDVNGTASVTRVTTQYDRPTGSVNVTIEGNDGSKPGTADY